ncbi:hypothetical protein [Arthrobacter sp. CAN_A1]|uniref:hypothetical protein n=1 Tax=Arthrobacter sp. CAN_A1 TaxID=2787717 RepID=UPI0018CABB9A
MNDTGIERRKWLEDFTLELRFRDVPGHLIGDAVSTVETHLEDTGERPLDAFGLPGDYADNLDLPRGRPAGPGAWIGRALAVAAMTVLPFAVTAIVTGTAVAVTALLLALILLAITALVVIAVNLESIVRSWAVWHSGLLGMGIALAYAAVIGLTPDLVLLRLPAIPVAAVAAVVVAGFIWQSVKSADPVIDPAVHTA